MVPLMLAPILLMTPSHGARSAAGRALVHGAAAASVALRIVWALLLLETRFSISPAPGRVPSTSSASSAAPCPRRLRYTQWPQPAWLRRWPQVSLDAKLTRHQQHPGVWGPMKRGAHCGCRRCHCAAPAAQTSRAHGCDVMAS